MINQPLRPPTDEEKEILKKIIEEIKSSQDEFRKAMYDSIIYGKGAVAFRDGKIEHISDYPFTEEKNGIPFGENLYYLMVIK